MSELAADAIAAGDSPLTPREADVLELAVGGASPEEIAVRASLSLGTVRNHLSAAVGGAGGHQPARGRGARPGRRLDLTPDSATIEERRSRSRAP